MAKIKNSFKYSKLLLISIISFLVIVSIMIALIFSYHVAIEKTFEKSISYNTNAIQNLSKIKTKSGKYTIILEDSLLQNIKKVQVINYKNFLEKYLEIQANWLNAWLTILAIILGILGIVIPICFAKFYENKKVEIEKYKVDLDDLVCIVKQKNNQLIRLLTSARNTNQRITSLFSDLENKKEQIDNLILETQKIQNTISDDYIFYKKQLDNLLKCSLDIKNGVDKEATEIKEKSMEITKIFSSIQEYAQEAQKIKLDTEANNYLNMSFQFYQDRKFLDALELINKALKINRCFEYLRYRAIIYSKMKIYEKAIDDYLEAISLHENDFLLYVSLGTIYLQAGQISPAIMTLDKAIELNPEHPITYYNIAEAYIRNHDYKLALNALKKYIDLSPSPFILDDDKIVWEEALDLAPNNSDAKTIKEIINHHLELKSRESFQ